MVQEQDWTEAYKELCAVINTAVTEIKHIDLWYEQIQYPADEYPFPPNSLFIDMNTDDIETVALNVQHMNCMITFYHVFDTLSDTFEGSTNQTIALEFMAINKKIHKALQGLSGVNFSPLDRKANKRIPTQEGYLNIRAQTYACIIVDYSAMKEYTPKLITDIGITNTPPPPQIGMDMYEVDL